MMYSITLYIYTLIRELTSAYSFSWPVEYGRRWFQLFFWIYVLDLSFPVYPCNGVWVIVTQYTFKSLSVVTPTLWHPYLKLLDSHLQKHYLRILLFIVFFLGCLGPVCFVFYFLMYFVFHVSKKIKKLSSRFFDFQPGVITIIKGQPSIIEEKWV